MDRLGLDVHCLRVLGAVIGSNEMLVGTLNLGEPEPLSLGTNETGW